VGLLAFVRCGPWCNGEVRYGGFPDWVQHSDKWEPPKRWGLRPEHPEYLAAVQRLYSKIGEQMQGLLWKDGGPVIGIQLDNEYSGPADYLLSLKKIAIESGMDVPIYTKTGWPRMESPLPLGEMIPFYGAYPEAAWEGNFDIFDGLAYNFSFRRHRIDETIASDVNTVRGTEDESSRVQYPFLTAETGGGMFVSYHRRSKLDPRDVASLALCQIGSGCVGVGYYMYHGGENPDGKRSPLNKSHEIGDVFDTNVKSYDFQAPIGQYGQIRPHYKWLRRMHFFLSDFGSDLAQMPASFPDKEDNLFLNPDHLRWSVRSNNNSGFVFVNNYQRLSKMPAKLNTQLRLNLPGGSLTLPKNPVTVPADSFFFWPFNMELQGITLNYATAQPVMRYADSEGMCVVFAEIAGMPAEFVFDAKTLAGAPMRKSVVFSSVIPGREPAFCLEGKDGRKLKVILLNEADSLELAGKPADLDGKLVFDKKPELKSHVVVWRSKLINESIPTSPRNQDFQSAAVWKVKLPPELDLSANPLLRIHYVGDMARLRLNGRLLNDHFYNGSTFEIGLKRYAPEVATGELSLEILPLQKEMPVYFEACSRPLFASGDTLLQVKSAEVVFQ
jgi:hypothetical protein